MKKKMGKGSEKITKTTFVDSQEVGANTTSNLGGSTTGALMDVEGLACIKLSDDVYIP